MLQYYSEFQKFEVLGRSQAGSQPFDFWITNSNAGLIFDHNVENKDELHVLNRGVIQSRYIATDLLMKCSNSLVLSFKTSTYAHHLWEKNPELVQFRYFVPPHLVLEILI